MVKACKLFTPSPMSVLVDRLLGSLLGIGAPKNLFRRNFTMQKLLWPLSPMSVLVDRLLGSLLGIGAPKIRQRFKFMTTKFLLFTLSPT